MVDRVLIERILSDIKSNLRELKQAQDISWEVYQADVRARRFVERTLHVMVEACIDVAQHIISDERFREPESYRDAFVVLSEQGVIPRDQLQRFESMAAFRNLIVHYYEKIDDAVVYSVFKKRLDDFQLFVDLISVYLREKQGVSEGPGPNS